MSVSHSRDRILDAAERRARTAGYNGFSFRDVAADVGIRSASVHHHFPTKADLCEALAARYRDAALERLGDPTELAPSAAIERVLDVFRAALRDDDMMCLCGIFAAERDVLPPPVQAATASFFQALLAFLATARGQSHEGPEPAAVVATAEGALLLARTLGDVAIFETAVRDLKGGALRVKPTG